MTLRFDWTREEVNGIYKLPFPELIYQAQHIHRQNFSNSKVQRSTLLSIKTGACPEDCKYCPQSAHHNTDLEPHKLLPKDEVLSKAKEALDEGSTRFCMGAAWRCVKDGPDFDHVLDLVSSVHDLGLEVCCTLGMLNEDQAKRLKDAGCHAYNHNLDTSPEYYGEVITTRTYDDRLKTLKNVRSAGITVCCGGIIGMGEGESDRIGLLVELANQNPHPESVPINMLVKVKGTPFDSVPEISQIEFVRMVATARIIMPTSMVRLSAGRNEMSAETQALCFIAGANSIFAGEKLLTTPNPEDEADRALMEHLGMSFVEETHAHADMQAA
ncbi:MAG: biotin synthase BioB [Bdellovibrionales bacterium]|nr:biotin synthase BioB [Bdellovibrionales bacterium]